MLLKKKVFIKLLKNILNIFKAINILKFHNFHDLFHKNNILDYYLMQGWRISSPWQSIQTYRPNWMIHKNYRYM